MSTKITILAGDGYHFYWDQSDLKYHLQTNSLLGDSGGYDKFMSRIGEILSGCNKSESGVYIFDLKKGGVKKWKSPPYKGCCQHECCRRKK